MKKKTQMTTKKKVLMSTLIPLSAAIVATSIAVPLVLLKKNPVEPEPTPTPSKDKETVTKLNNLLAAAKEEGLTFNTMSALVAYLSLHEVDLESLSASNSDQYVWDSAANNDGIGVIFTMKTSGEVSCAPDGYTLNQNKYEIWKMVNFSKPSNLRLFSSERKAKASNGTTETFDANSQYGQYLRSGQDKQTEQITFSCCLDTGSNEDLNLKYKGESVTYTPKIVTYCSDLEIEGSLKDVDHYGHAKSITVTELDATYNEYGTVDGNIILKDGDFVAKPACEINTILIESTNVESVIVEQETVAGVSVPAVVGTIATTSSEVDVGEIVDSEVTVEEAIPVVKEDPITPTTRYECGFGTENSPYVIANSTQLTNCATDVNTSSSVDNKFYFKLKTDINLNGVEWTPIGASADLPFRGIFDGNGYTISNFKIKENVNRMGSGLFGYTGIMDQERNTFTINDVWSTNEKHIILGPIAESKYKTVVKNIIVDNVDIEVTNDDPEHTDHGYYAGGIIGWAKNTFVYNNVVKSGTISGYKHVGAITGAVSGSVIMGCVAGSDEQGADGLNISADIYNVGGISGSTNRSNYGCCATVSCETERNVKVTAKANKTGAIGGIVGYDGNADVNLIDDCVNNATVEQICADAQSDSYIGGILGAGYETNVIANCINNGDIIVADGSKIGYLGGISCLPHNLVHNCVNNGNVSGYAIDAVAGVAAGCEEGTMISNSSCKKDVTVENTNPNPTFSTARIAAGYSELEFEDQTFANVDELNNAIKSVGSPTTSITLEFKNCTVTDTSDKPLEFPASNVDITSDNKLCDSVKVDNTISSLKIDIPSTNITVSEQTSCQLNVEGDDSIVTIADTGKVHSVIVSGERSQVKNYGTVTRTICVDGGATYGGNMSQYASCANVAFGLDLRSTCDKTFDNYGKITGTTLDGATNNAVIYTKGDLNNHTVTIRNYDKGSINYAGTLSTPAPFFQMVDKAMHLIVECYSGSSIINSKSTNWFTIADATNSILFKHKATGVTLQEAGSDISFETLAAKSQYVTEEEF